MPSASSPKSWNFSFSQQKYPNQHKSTKHHLLPPVVEQPWSKSSQCRWLHILNDFSQATVFTLIIVLITFPCSNHGSGKWPHFQKEAYLTISRVKFSLPWYLCHAFLYPKYQSSSTLLFQEFRPIQQQQNQWTGVEFACPRSVSLFHPINFLCKSNDLQATQSLWNSTIVGRFRFENWVLSFKGQELTSKYH